MNFNLRTFTAVEATAALTTGGVDVYTVPADKVAIVLSSRVVNIDATNHAYATVRAEVGASTPEHASTYDIPPNNFLDHPVKQFTFLLAGKDIKGVASADGDLVMTVSLVLFDP